MGSGCRNADGMLFRQIHEHSVPGVRDGLEATSGAQDEQRLGVSGRRVAEARDRLSPITRFRLWGVERRG